MRWCDFSGKFPMMETKQDDDAAMRDEPIFIPVFCFFSLLPQCRSSLQRVAELFQATFFSFVFRGVRVRVSKSAMNIANRTREHDKKGNRGKRGKEKSAGG